ncbi:hypothetical protein SAMN04490195_1165 [Pseudomonas moorei]|uniref:Uncharacterized protein n=1 Tax=Pseudomonas moorei TaxID=395599 RepID=A0A1H1CDN8_9PSED|nr:hypothetical protein SAMN04490195_1165 [Pseudomonas moorei]
MDVNDDARLLDKRGALGSIVETPPGASPLLSRRVNPSND